jgi:hypothetical protein
VCGQQRIALTFTDAKVGSVKASPLLESLLAPALLPRGWWNQRALLALREVRRRRRRRQRRQRRQQRRRGRPEAA